MKMWIRVDREQWDMIRNVKTISFLDSSQEYWIHNYRMWGSDTSLGYHLLYVALTRKQALYTATCSKDMSLREACVVKHGRQ